MKRLNSYNQAERALRGQSCTFHKNVYKLPSHDALAQILPKNNRFFKGVKAESHGETPEVKKKPEEANKPNKNNTFKIHQPHKRPPLHGFGDDPHMAEVSTLQTKEVENYRSAMTRMADDIILMRTQMVTLEAENSRLRCDLSLHQDHGRVLLNDADIEGMTKADISEFIASLKLKVASETSKAASQRDRIQQLQRDLIKKNESEKQFLKLQRVHQQQKEDLQRELSCMAKMATLEDNVHQQEKVIDKMENTLDVHLSDKEKQIAAKKVEGNKLRVETNKIKENLEVTLAVENKHLRDQLDQIPRQPDPLITQQSEQTKDTMPLTEKVSLLHRLEQAEAKVQTLEAQLEENSKLRERQKQEMLNKLSEHRHGLIRTSTKIFHSYPSTIVSEPRQRIQKPSKGSSTVNC